MMMAAVIKKIPKPAMTDDAALMPSGSPGRSFPMRPPQSSAPRICLVLGVNVAIVGAAARFVANGADDTQQAISFF
jgi:hypothetical protein